MISNYFVIGLGNFGIRVVDFISKKFPEINYFAIDTDFNDLRKINNIQGNNIIFISKEILKEEVGFCILKNTELFFARYKKMIWSKFKQLKTSKTFIVCGLGCNTGNNLALPLALLLKSLNYEVHIIASWLLFGSKKAEEKIKDFFKNLEVNKISFDAVSEDFVRAESGDKKMNDAFEWLCLYINERMVGNFHLKNN